MRFRIHLILLLVLSFGILWWTYRYDFVGLRGFVQGDLGLILNVPWRLLQGELPYRDFYAGNYTPGSYYAHAALFALFGRRASVLSAALAISQTLSVFLVYLLSRLVAGRGIALVLAGGALFLGIPHVNIGFPAIYCIFFGLLALYAALRYGEKKNESWVLVAGFSIGFAFAFKISAGVFLFATLLWLFLIVLGYQKIARGFSLLLFAATLFLLRDRFLLATVLLFVFPMALLVSITFRLSEKTFPKRRDRALWLRLFLPILLVNAVWALPFLWILGSKDFLHHFLFFPAAQAKVLYYPPALPLPDSLLGLVAPLGFSGLKSWQSFWKILLYAPYLMAVATASWVVHKGRTKTAAPFLAFYAYNALMNLQMFPTIDHLHLKWSAHGALLLCVAYQDCSVRSKKAVSTLAAFSLFFLLAFFIHYGLGRYESGGFRKVFPETLNLSYPAKQAEALEQVSDFLESNLAPGERFWNPPGALLNFILDRPFPLRSDYLGPHYLSEQSVQDLLQQVHLNPPKIVVIPDLPEENFGWESLGRNYPLIQNDILQHYPRRERMGDYLLFFQSDFSQNRLP